MYHFIPLMLSLVMSFAGGNKKADHSNTINAAIGDISYVKSYGYRPTDQATEADRIKTHLEYVEELLISKDVSRLPEAMRQKRKKLIALLHEYRTAGRFPRNYDHQGRRPCFIDRDGNICAVGYLVEQTAGRAVAEVINAKHQYDYIADINSPELAEWVSASGLTKDECAMIQPSYGYRNPPRQVPLSYTLSTAVLTGVNLALTTVNVGQSLGRKPNNTVPVVSFVTGTVQAVLGTVYLSNSVGSRAETTSIVNIATGTATIICGILNLAQRADKPAKSTEVSLGSFSTIRNEPVVGFTLTRKL